MAAVKYYTHAVSCARGFSRLAPSHSEFSREVDDQHFRGLSKQSESIASFIRSVQPSPLSHSWNAVFSYAFDALHFSHVVLNTKTFEVVDFSNKRWTLEGANEMSSRFLCDDNDRSLNQGLGTLKKLNMALLKHMIECTTCKAIPMEGDCIVTELYTSSYEDKTKKIKDLVAYNMVRGLLYEVMINRRRGDEKGETVNFDDVIFEIDRSALNKFFGMQILSKRKERFLLDESKARQLLKSSPIVPKLPDNFLSSSSPEVNSQTLIASLLRAVAFATCFSTTKNSLTADQTGRSSFDSRSAEKVTFAQIS